MKRLRTDMSFNRRAIFLIKSSLVITGIAGWSAISAAEEIDPYGMCNHPTFTKDHARSSAEFDLIKKIGVHQIRTDFHWTGLGTRGPDDPFDFKVYDAALSIAKESGIEILPILTDAPEHARPLHEHRGLWRDYVKQVVSRYSGSMKTWEVWNEHNLFPPSYWGRAEAAPKNYAEALGIAYETIKKIDPELKVVYGGTAHVPIDYIRRTFENGAARHFDIMNVHPYGTSDLPESFIPHQFAELKALMADYGIQDKPIWATEIGWPTVTSEKPWIYKAILPAAFREIGIDPSKTTLGVIHDVEEGFAVQSPAFDMAGNLPAFRKVMKVRLSELSKINIKDCPVLVAARDETFPRVWFGDLVDYVRRGGTIILPGGLPFVTDQKTPGKGMKDTSEFTGGLCKALHIQVDGYWSMGIGETTTIAAAPGIELPNEKMKNARFLGMHNLTEGDHFIPLVFGIEGENRYPWAGVYRLDSELKGNVIVLAARDHGVREQVSREFQSHFLSRSMILLLAEGVEKIFWYRLTSNGVDADGNREANFGIMDKDDHPKPAYQAYATLVHERPSGSTRPVVEHEGELYKATWKRPDGAVVLASWTLENVSELKLEPGRYGSAVNEAGETVEIKRGTTRDSIAVGPWVVYLRESRK